MASNLLTQLMNDFRGDALNGVASALGESSARTQSALDGVLPALIGGLALKAATTDQAGHLLDVIKRSKLDTDTFTDASSALKAPGGFNTLTNMGRPLMDSLFGGRSAAITDWVASHSGVSRSSSSSLLNLALPIVLGAIAKHVSSMGWSASNLMSLLGGQRAFLQDAPAGLAGLLQADDTTRRVGAYENEPRRPAHVAAYEAAPKRSSWLWALPLLFLIPLLGYFLARHDEPRREVAVQTTSAPRTEVPRAVPDPAGPVGTTSEPSAVPVRLGPYRLEFATGSPTLTVASMEELRKVVAMLKAHPQVRVEIAGYTDNAGNDADNLRLSQERATATMNEIAILGIDRSRMTAEGYGESQPAADNATTEGRHRNRRVEIRVIDK